MVSANWIFLIITIKYRISANYCFLGLGNIFKGICRFGSTSIVTRPELCFWQADFYLSQSSESFAFRFIKKIYDVGRYAPVLVCKLTINIIKFTCINHRFAAHCNHDLPWTVNQLLCSVAQSYETSLYFILPWNNCVFPFPLWITTIACPCSKLMKLASDIRQPSVRFLATQQAFLTKGLNIHIF